MSRNEILKGTAILTATGVITRFMGFFYRIYLGRTFGEEGVGIYQLVFPVFAFCYAVSAAGIETALSRAVARRYKKSSGLDCQMLFWIALFISLTVSLLLLVFVRSFADVIAVSVLKEPRCKDMLLILAFAIPLSAIHSCVSGYYYGIKDTRIPAISQLLEQTIRIGSVCLIVQIASSSGSYISINYAVYGLVLGELASSLFSFQFFWNRFSGNTGYYEKQKRLWIGKIRECLRELLALSVPLTANRMLLTALQSLESISIPAELVKYGHSTETALSIYGVLTGMALPCILFPTAVTNAASVMLLPAVAELQASNADKRLRRLFRNAVSVCVGLGCAFAIFFLFAGKIIGTLFFKSPMASSFILNLAFICPFLYTNATMLSMINGMGKASLTFAANIAGLLIRIFFIWKYMAVYGIRAYLFGLLFSHVVIFILCICIIHRLLEPRQNS